MPNHIVKRRTDQPEGESSSRGSLLHRLKTEARKIREDHAAGKISAEEAARKLNDLQSPTGTIFWHDQRVKASA